MQTILPILIGAALVLALVIPVLSFLLFSFRRWRRAQNYAQGVVFRGLTVFSIVGLLFNSAYVRQALFAPGGPVIEPNWLLGAAFLIAWSGFWGKRMVNVLSRRSNRVFVPVENLG